MSTNTGIQWTDATWNPVVGCTKVSQGCKHCYAKQLHDQRFKAASEGKMQAPQYSQPFERVQLMYDRLTMPLAWRKPRRVFVNSVSDLFHEDVPFEFIRLVFATMMLARHHTFQVLTKRPARMVRFFETMAAHPHGWLPVYQLHATQNDHFFAIDSKATRDAKNRIDRAPWYGKDTPWPLPNVWLGVSVENQDAAEERIPLLIDTPAAVRFLSCEPLLGPLDLSKYLLAHHLEGHCATRGVHWVIVGGESGRKARPFDIEWAHSLVKQCRDAGVAPFVKQLGAHVMNAEGMVDVFGLGVRVENDRAFLRDAHGGDMAEWPEDLRIREFPRAAA